MVQWLRGRQYGPVVKEDSSYVDSPGLIPGASRNKLVVGSHYQTG